MVINDIEELLLKKRINPEYIQEGIKALEGRKGIIIRPADKGGGVVILEKSFYHDQLIQLLGNQTTYRMLSGDPTEAYRDQLNLLIEWGFRNGAVNAKESQYLNPSSCRIPVIYTLPKIHKSVDNPPAHPIVNGIGSVTARLGEYLDWFLQPSVKNTRAYLK